MEADIKRAVYGSIYGMKLVSHEFIPEFEEVPVKIHRHNMNYKTINYHNRIQKKWLKRFGTKKIRPIHFTAGAIFAHPNTIRFIKRVVSDEHSMRSFQDTVQRVIRNEPR